MEAAGVELLRVLTTRKLLILGTATPAKKASLPDPLYVYCTKILFALESHGHHIEATVSHRIAGMDRERVDRVSPNPPLQVRQDDSESYPRAVLDKHRPSE